MATATIGSFIVLAVDTGLEPQLILRGNKKTFILSSNTIYVSKFVTFLTGLYQERNYKKRSLISEFVVIYQRQSVFLFLTFSLKKV